MSNSKIEKFEDLIAWQKSRELVKQIYKVTEKEDFSKDFGLKKQIQRAGVSIMSNIAEGFDRFRPNEFHQFLSIAKGSCAEVRSQLYIANDIGYLTEDEFNQLKSAAEEVSKIINGLRSYIETQKS
jgi:four helix bundle protein